MSSTKWFAVCIFTLSGSAMAQNTVGELLDMGAKQIPQGELVNLLSGLIMSGPSFDKPGATIRFEYSANGTVSGGPRMPDGRVFSSTGTWKVDESGKFCRDMTSSNGAKWGDCRYFFRLADNYYAAETNDRGTKIEPRIFEKK